MEQVKTRGFELITKYSKDEELLPRRSTSQSAGYDFMSAMNTKIEPNEIKLIPLGVKAYMQQGEVLCLFDRSSNPQKKGLVLINSVGVIDKDYYNNPDNEGHIYAQMKNITNETVFIQKGDRIVQGIFLPFLIADNDSASATRVGGFGSTGK